MKKYMMLLAAAGLAFTCGAVAPVAPATDPEPAERVPVSSGKTNVLNLVFVGDSITFGAHLASPRTEAPPAQAADWLEKHVPGPVTVEFRNLGVSGARTDELLPGTARWTVIKAACDEFKGKPGRLVFSVMIGANDAYGNHDPAGSHSPARFEKDLTALCRALLKACPKAILVVNGPTGFPMAVKKGDWRATLRDYIPVLPVVVAKLGKQFPDRVFLGDARAWKLLSADGPKYYADNIHPNAAGAAIVGRLWGEAIRSALGRTAWFMAACAAGGGVVK